MSNNNISIAKNIQVSKNSNNKQKTHQKRNNNLINKKNIKIEKNQSNIQKEVSLKENKVKKLIPKIRITPLGGVDEVAKNMYMIEIADEIFVLDAGLMFPETEMIGIDAVIPDISYLVRNKQKVKGIFLSNGHVSSMGAVPYIIDKLKCPVYGSKLTIDLLKNHLKHQ